MEHSVGNLSASLSGIGVVPTVMPASTVVFNDLGPGVPSTKTVTVTLSNVAETASFTFTAPLIGSAAYSVPAGAPGGTCLAASPVALGGTNPTSCTINVAYTPSTGVDTSPTATLTVNYAFGTAAATQLVAQLSLGEINPTGGTVAAGGGTTVEVELSAVPTTVTLPDGSSVPMWGYQCGANSLACTALNPAVRPRGASAAWSPVVITAMAGQSLAIDLTNNLSFGATPNNIPTSIVIVGQLGAGLGAAATSTPSPAHATQDTTWPIAVSGPQNMPPPQGNRVQSFAHRSASGDHDAPGLEQSQARHVSDRVRHPSLDPGPDGPVRNPGGHDRTRGRETPGCAYPGATAGTCAVTYSAEVPLLLGEIDPVQNSAVNAAVNTAAFSETMVWSGQPGGCGNPASASYNQCYPPAVNYTPLYYLINGVAFNKNGASASLFAATPGTAPGSGQRQRAGALRERGLAHARTFDRRRDHDTRRRAARHPCNRGPGVQPGC